MNLALIKPNEKYIEEIHAFRQEFVDNGETIPGTYEEFMRLDISEWISFCKLCEKTDTLPKFPGRRRFVEHEQFLLLRETDNKILGVIMLRHKLDEQLLEFGGHIGFSIRPSERRKGYAKIMLSLCLEKSSALEYSRVLVTCNANNKASRKAIIACGGMFDRIAIEFDGGKVERYWIPCGDIRMRKAEVGDESTVSLILCKAWQSAFSDIITPDDMAKFADVKRHTANFRRVLENGGFAPTYIAALNGNQCGIISFGKSRDLDSPNTAEIIVIHSLDSVWGKGVGHAMMEFAIMELRRQGYHEVMLWVFEANDRARKFYERHGFMVDGTVKDSGFGSAKEVRYRRDNL